jgi:hypothetical protein
MNDKFKNYPVNVFCSEIIYGDFGTKQHIESVEKVNDNIYKVVTNLETIEINQHEFDILNERINKELSEAHNEALQRAYFEDQNSGFHQYEM